MATYYPSLSSQNDNLQNSYTGDQKVAFFSELPSYINSITTYNQPSATGPYSESFPVNSMSSQNSAEFQARNEMVFIPPTSGTMNIESLNEHINTSAGNPVSNSVTEDSHFVQRTQLGVLDGEHNFHRQRLSLSLNSQMQSAVSVSSLDHHFSPLLSTTNLHTAGKWELSCDGDVINQSKDLKNSDCFSVYDGSNHNTTKIEGSHHPRQLLNVYESSAHENSILKSKYLMAAQQLLNEVVNVKKALKQHDYDRSLDTSKDADGRTGNQSLVPTSTGMSSDHGDSVANSSSELLPAERQDLQNKKTKLLSMLVEVDRRYKQYYHHMQTMVSSFDMVAGHGAAKSYTALARQTISRHFRCVRDAISDQIEVIRRKLGEQDTSSSQVLIRRLRYVDHQLRHQRAFQHLGVNQHAWRPQRGLPESSVSILRAWLFEHFLHPYPNDTEKIMLAKQTGLTRNQVANWFINARVRLWKPMVEEMYKEEFGDSEANSKSSLDDATKAHGENHLALENRLDELQDSLTSTAADSFLPAGQFHDLKSNHTSNVDMKIPTASTVLQKISHAVHVTDSQIMKLQCDKRSNMHEESLYQNDNISQNQNVDRSLVSSSIDISQLSRHGVGSQVSLALGLQHHESDAFPMSIGTQLRGNNASTAASVGPEAVDYHFMEPIKQQDRFGNSHLLHDFAV